MASNSLRELLDPHVYEDICLIADTDLPWESFSNKTILITGAAGFIGYYLTLSLLMLNDRHHFNLNVIGLVRNSQKARDKFGQVLERSDLTLLTQDVCLPLETEVKPHYIIHAASPASNLQFETQPAETLQANLSGTINMLELARKCGALSVLILSSLKVYGDFKDHNAPLSEEEKGLLNFEDYKNCYAVGKRASETLCASYKKEYGLSVKIARPSYVYGASSLTDDRVWAQFMSDIAAKRDILLKSSGTVYRSFCYIADTAAGLFTILLKGADGEAYNISDENSNITIRSLAAVAAEAFPERNIRRRFADPCHADPAMDQEKTRWEILDNHKISLLGFHARMDLTAGIRRSVQILENAINNTEAPM